MAPEVPLGIFLVFCRVGSCIMIMPGLASTRVPLQIRLFIALAVSLSAAPLLNETTRAVLVGQVPVRVLGLVCSETVTGLLIGFLGRIYYVALQTFSTAAAMAIGFGSIPGSPIDESEPLPAVSSLIMIVATAILFLSDLHLELFRGLAASYSRIPLGNDIGARLSLVQIVDHVGAAFTLALRITSPFIVYSVIVNLAIALTNKLTPQIPVFFMATPFVMLGGLMLMYYLTADYVLIFTGAVSTWIKGS